jgi:hypothetical protein
MSAVKMVARARCEDRFCAARDEAGPAIGAPGCVERCEKWWLGAPLALVLAIIAL